MYRKDFETHFAKDRLKLPSAIFEEILSTFSKQRKVWDSWIERSFLTEKTKKKYRTLIDERSARLSLP
jgi:hypothetical protein